MDEVSMLAHQGGIGVIFVYTLQLLKSSKWFPWISENSAALNRWLGLLIALLTSLGFKFLAIGSAATGYHITIDVPNLATLSDAITHAAAQFAGQQLLYHAGGVKDTVGGMRTLEMESGVVRGAVAQVAIGEQKTDKKEDASKP